ncbi:DUF6281 family protein [Streptomyces sp. NPDC005483]|uniref:DUF6281 family protein n=1 Tax=Streptomyces sp. NPDC005483 TaxID=3154882 RepID=UPI0033BBB7A4
MTTALRFLAVTLFAAVAGCTSGGETASSCAGSVRYGNREYLPAQEVGFTVGERLGTAEILECDDTPSDPGATIREGTTGAYAVEGQEPAEAIAVGDTPTGARLMKVG